MEDCTNSQATPRAISGQKERAKMHRDGQQSFPFHASLDSQPGKENCHPDKSNQDVVGNTLQVI